MAFEDKIKELAERREKAEIMGGPEKLEKRKDAGILNAAERVEYLYDKGTFRESGLFGTSYLPEMKDQTPRDGKICGFGKIDGRKAGIVAYYFTVKGSSSSYTNNKKMSHIKDTGTKRGFPVVFLGESTGVRMPDVMGEGMGFTAEGSRFLRRRKAPWFSAQLGMCFGSSAWHAVCSDFNVMRKGAVMAVASPRMVSQAVGHKVTGEDLGGWRVHADHTGFADAVADTDEEAIDIVKTFLSYLPGHQNEVPPTAPVPDGSGKACKDMLELMPESLAKTYDVRKIIQAVADTDSFFEIKARYGKSITTRVRPHQRAQCWLHRQQPAIQGRLHGRAVLREGDELPGAVRLLQHPDGVPAGPAGLPYRPGHREDRHHRQGHQLDERAAADHGAENLHHPPEELRARLHQYGRRRHGRGSRRLVHRRGQLHGPALGGLRRPWRGSPERPGEIRAAPGRMARDSSAYGLASVYGVKEVLDPRETRDYLIDMLDTHCNRLEGGIGKHLLEAWPTSYV